jgi:hypothetical protein
MILHNGMRSLLYCLYHASGKTAINCWYPTNKAIHYITMQHDSGYTMGEEIGWGTFRVQRTREWGSELST